MAYTKSPRPYKHGVRALQDRIGKRFGKLTVLEETEGTVRSNGRVRRYFLCMCDCGSPKKSSYDNLSSGAITNCGCESLTHGFYGTRLYNTWKGMIQRTTDSNHPSFKGYGDRGISVCEEWKTAKKFFEWANSSGYKSGLTIDRIDVNGNYEPSNCRWATQKEQSANKRNTVYVELGGKLVTISEASEITGVKPCTIRWRHNNSRNIVR
jgi:hypothetical protein